ncbi:MAG: 4-hydroxyphenylpyruvate dioxygenase [Cyanobacteria bacterium P01_A01_bin.135]
MDFSYAHFYVDDATAWQTWFEGLNFTSVRAEGVPSLRLPHTQTLAVQAGGGRFLLSSPLTSASPVAHYLQHHPPGVADLAFRVDNLDRSLLKATAQGAAQLSPIASTQCDDLLGLVSEYYGPCRWACVSGWGGLRHTLIEARPLELPIVRAVNGISGIDHAVLNVRKGEMLAATAWYEAAFGLCRHQSFAIHTQRSALCSQVLKHPQGALQLPINEPTSPTSQIQEFLDVNGGAGIQHIALQTTDIVATVHQLRQQGVAFISVPKDYYTTLPRRAGFCLSDRQQAAIAQAQILVDWQAEKPHTLLLQTFTQPIFGEPTFFFELIQRQTYDLSGVPQYAKGFGEGNFQALFEAMEREQLKRGRL